MGQLAPEVKIIEDAVGDMIDILHLHTEDGTTSHIGELLLNHRFEKVPKEQRRAVYFCFEAHLEYLKEPRYDA